MIDRRTLLQMTTAGAALSMAPSFAAATAGGVITKTIPKTGEALPVIGMGSSRTFDALNDTGQWGELTEVLDIFFDQGGTLIDSSPMYRSSEELIGILMQRIKNGFERMFSATKVWIDGEQDGIDQMTESFAKMNVGKIDLMQIHNLRDWKVHLPTLRRMKDEGQIRYIGVTTSHGRNHDELADLLQAEDFDFVQLSYSIDERSVETRLLPLAIDKGVAVLANRPFRRGDTFNAVKDKPLPNWAADIGCESWAQYFLKYAASHPAVTCVIPATANSQHMLDNMGANRGSLPDGALRSEMLNYFNTL